MLLGMEFNVTSAEHGEDFHMGIEGEKLPNLFTYAKRELSQDAFFCWMFAWANHPHSELGKVGRSLLELFLRQLPGGLSCNGLARLEVEQQVAFCDIVVICEFTSGRTVALAIEDKIGAMLDADQLDRNREKVLRKLSSRPKRTNRADLTACSFLLKTDFDFGIVPPKASYKVNYLDLSSWLSTTTAGSLASSDILRDWGDSFKQRCAGISDRLRAAADLATISSAAGSGTELDNHLKTSWWQDPTFQFGFFKALLGVSDGDIVRVAESRADRKLWFTCGWRTGAPDMLHFGNRAGRPWIRHWFSDNFFYQLTLVQGLWAIKMKFTSPAHHELDDHAMRRIRNDFESTFANHGLQVLQTQPREGSTMRTLFAIDQGKSRELQHFVRLHSEVCRRHRRLLTFLI